IPVLGCSTVVRIAEYLRQSGIEEVSVFNSQSQAGTPTPFADVESLAWSGAARRLGDYGQDGMQTVLVIRAGAYVECDLGSFISQHRDYGCPVSRAVDEDGPLELWAIDLSRFGAEKDLLSALASESATECEIAGYVNRLREPQDFRRLATDVLTGKCKM